LVKLALQRDGYYTLTEDDQFDIDVFERLACEEHFADQSDTEPPWTAVRRRARWRRRFPWIDESDLD